MSRKVRVSPSNSVVICFHTRSVILSWCKSFCVACTMKDFLASAILTNRKRARTRQRARNIITYGAMHIAWIITQMCEVYYTWFTDEAPGTYLIYSCEGTPTCQMWPADTCGNVLLNDGVQPQNNTFKEEYRGMHITWFGYTACMHVGIRIIMGERNIFSSLQTKLSLPSSLRLSRVSRLFGLQFFGSIFIQQSWTNKTKTKKDSTSPIYYMWWYMNDVMRRCGTVPQGPQLLGTCFLGLLDSFSSFWLSLSCNL